jgi:hypothetical protein
MERFLSTMRRRFDDLGIPDEFLRILTDVDPATRDAKAPIVAVYFAGDNVPAPGPLLNKLISNASTVVPVVQELKRFREVVPEALWPFNAIELNPNDSNMEELVNVVLENLGLLRSSRHLFISYRRAETRTIAVQLYEHLSSQGFDVFLDTHDIRPGEPFQEVLWHRLADTDVIVLLDSPGFLESQWTEEELARANTANVQILQLVWPGNVFGSPTAFSRPLRLESIDFVTTDTLGDAAQLQSPLLTRIGVEVESLRARALAARYAYLVQEFCETTNREAGVRSVPEYSRIISLEYRGRSIAVVPTIGVPDALRYNEVENLVNARGVKFDELVVLYDERGIRDRWLQHMHWLDSQLRLRSLKVAATPSWVRSL